MALPQHKHTTWSLSVLFFKADCPDNSQVTGHSVFKVHWRGLTWSGLPHVSTSPAKEVLSDQRMKHTPAASCREPLSLTFSEKGKHEEKLGCSAEGRIWVRAKNFLTQKASKILAGGRGPVGFLPTRIFKGIHYRFSPAW